MLQTNQKLNWKTPCKIHINITFIWLSKAMRLKIENGFTEGQPFMFTYMRLYRVCLKENVNLIILCEMSPTRKC